MDRPEDTVAVLVGGSRMPMMAILGGSGSKQELVKTRDVLGWRYYLHDTRISLPVLAMIISAGL